MKPSPSVRERIEARVERIPIAGCWIWTAQLNGAGYGVFGIRQAGQSVPVRAHRLSYEAYLGPVPEGLFVLHRCDTRSCVNPAHLFVGTQRDNIQDMIAKGRSKMTSTANAAKTHCKHGHEFTEGSFYLRKNGSRLCKQCNAEYQHNYIQSKRRVINA